MLRHGTIRSALASGGKLVREFRAAVATLQRNPLAYAADEERVRRLFLRRFPYGIFYEVRGAEITVIAFFHTSRDPEAWRSRL